MPNGQVTLPFGDGDHVFNIAKLGQMLELEDKCGGVGIMEIYARVIEKRWRINDIRETIRLGLIGGGAKPVEALTLTKRYVDEYPLMENVEVAKIILAAAIVGVPGDEVGKGSAEQVVTEPPASDLPVPHSTV